MATHEQHLKNDYRQSKRVVIRSPYDSIKGLILQLGRRMCRYSNKAQVVTSLRYYLETVAVDKSDRSISGDEDTCVINIADDLSVFMNHCKGTSDVGRRVDEERPTHVWEICQTALDSIKDMDLFMINHSWHQQPGNASSGTIMKRINRPCGQPEQPFCFLVNHEGELLRFLVVNRFMVHLGHCARIVADLENAAFATAAQLARERYRLSLAVIELYFNLSCHEILLRLVAGQAYAL